MQASTKGALTKLNQRAPSPMILGLSNRIKFLSKCSYPNSSCSLSLLPEWIRKSSNVTANRPTVKYLTACPGLDRRLPRVYSSLSDQTAHATSRRMKFTNLPALHPLSNAVALNLGRIGGTVAPPFSGRRLSNGPGYRYDIPFGPRPTTNNK